MELESNSKIKDLIEKIQKMSVKPSIESDLSQVLDEFLFRLDENDKYLENGIYNMNFAEAALLLQSSADLYSKKVDLLWDVIFDYQKRMLISEEQNGNKKEAIEKLEERKSKYKRKRKTNLGEAQANALVNSFSFGKADSIDYLNQNYEITDLFKEWERFNNEQPTHSFHVLNSKKKSLFLPNSLIYTEDNDYIGRYDQFHFASLMEEIFDLEKQRHLKDRFMESHNFPEKGPPLTQDCYQQLCLQKSFVYLEKIPFDVMKEKLRRASAADSLLNDDDNLSTASTHSLESHVANKIDQISGNLENRSKSCSQDSAFYDDDHINESEVSAIAVIDNTCESQTDLIDPGQEDIDNVGVDTTVEETITATTANTTEPSLTSVESFTVIAENDVISTSSQTIVALGKNETEKVSTTTLQKARKDNLESCITNDKPCLGSSVIITTRKVLKRWTEMEDPEEKEEKIKRRKLLQQTKMLEKKLAKLATGITTRCRDFEKFVRSEYRPAEDEGTVVQDMSESEESEDEDNDDTVSNHMETNEIAACNNNDEEMPDLDETNGRNSHLSFDRLEERNRISPAEALENREGLSLVPKNGEPTSSYDLQALERPLTLVSNDDLTQEEQSRNNVRQWRAFILPKIKNLEHNKSDFDIHEYGSRIIEPLEIGEQRFFKDVVQGKSSKEVARVFLATLQLANTRNVEIMGAVAGQSSSETFQIKVLDKTRHHELLEDYQAPSEETFIERLERAQALNPSVLLHSTPNVGPPAKKPKYNTSKKKLF